MIQLNAIATASLNVFSYNAGAGQEQYAMRAAVEILILSVAVFAAAFVTRRMFLWDVMPVSWDQEPPQNGTLEAAYFLLSVENLAGIVAALALGMIVVLLLRRRRRNRAQGA